MFTIATMLLTIGSKMGCSPRAPSLALALASALVVVSISALFV